MVRSSLFGLLSVPFSSMLFASNPSAAGEDIPPDDPLFHRYPSIDDAIVAEVVGASHFNFDRVKELVSQRPELARATWDWAFGDWETALGAASHVGRRDIANFLMANGARPDIFTFAMFGKYEVVKSMIESTPGIESIAGPHGISLLSHAKAGLRSNYGITLTDQEIQASEQLIAYLEELGTANRKEKDIPMSANDKEKYLGDYRYGDGENEGFTVRLNMRENLSLGKLGKSGGALFQKEPNVFTYNGITSVEVHFEVEGDKVISLTVYEPDLILKAAKT
ncbi:hypothetical protein GCM10011361_12240 [Muriicola marianensis]|uniref:Ankyrin repeat domain-containing protein n=2 Tax=Muriicola marianensis TaxID=1324801 RepID=A0ABQ1QUI8_9FLAO|nr:hypothetical protein GCM10011361_12240 [Muriicola marianensis]